MPISPKVRWLFWMVFSACYATILFVSLNMLKRGGSFDSEFMRSMTNPLALLMAAGLTVMLCRVAGLTLKSQVESPLKVEERENTPTSSEIRSYSARTLLRGLACFYGCAAVVMILAELFMRSRNKIQAPFWPIFLGILAVAGVSCLLSHFNRRGKFVARADEEGVEIQDLGQRNKRIHLKWSEIASSVRVDNFSVMGNSSLLEFRNVTGKAKAQVALSLAPLPQQREFAQVVAQYLSASAAS